MPIHLISRVAVSHESDMAYLSDSCDCSVGRHEEADFCSLSKSRISASSSSSLEG